MEARNLAILVLIGTIFLRCISAHGWGADDMEVFDVVEEVNENFYALMQINQTATSQEIKRAFRTLSVVLHPDKNDAEDANIKFRNLVSVYEVLKDPGKREKYDRVLKEGLPNWKSALYYYRRVRKVGLAEGAAILLIVATVMQYFIAWAAYAEKKYTAEQILGSRLKKLQKKHKTNVDIDMILREIPTPSIWNLLPFQIPLCIWRTVTGTPGAVKSAVHFYAEQKRLEEERKLREKEEEELQRKLEEERARLKENRTMRRRNKKFVAPEKTDEELAGYSQSIIKQTEKQKQPEDTASDRPGAKPAVSGGLWTEDDLVELVRLVKKYPGGTTDRWEIIAEMMGRSVTEVTYMAAKMKEGGYKVAGQTESVAETIVQEASKQKVKTKKTDAGTDGGAEATANWSQSQQAALETAIQKYPKSASVDRWQKIANCVPGKTKEECMTRYKYLVELVKKQKEREKESVETPLEECSVEERGIEVENDAELKSKSKNNRKQESEENALERNEVENGSAENGKTTGGKAKNKRRERKKAIEYYNYEDSQGESDPGEI
ncbi:uncharacterized protein F54F2.9 [Topomyia yanbarensis]|uniref:uncharacterized protein F54F2.9 n=1 Tax=Topomyia yanbarensis TaxID=2498891 RepID=UPI00273A9293|nr:uncharacterized protein F54F2.9 [Topomyia yanbarensis]